MDRRKVLLAVAAVIAALGTLLVFLYVHGADTRADARYSAVTVLRATKQIDAGETVAAAQTTGKITSGSISQQDVLAGALTSLDSVADKVATTTILPGEQLVTGKFGATGSATTGLTIPKGRLAISVNLSDPAQAVAGFVTPGDKVTVFMTVTGDKGGAQTRMLLPSVQVIAVGATTAVPVATDPAAATPAAEPVAKTVMTLALTQDEAERVIFATRNGDLAFGLINNDSQVSASGGVSMANLFR
ncbi:MAG: hypothetical protein JWR42_31 [Marmoricola sp.]|nr:hypothetical protein [Marmoricola sp.]